LVELTIVDFLDLRTISAIVNSKASARAVLCSHLRRGTNAKGKWYKG
jgi:hypothetical protein